MHVEAVYALPDAQQQVTLELVKGATIADALTLLSNTPISAEWQVDTTALGLPGRLKSVDFVASGLLARLIEPIAQRAADRMVDAFAQRIGTQAVSSDA